MYNFNKLKNGLSLITIPMSGTNTVTALIVVGTGSKYESKNISGISHFLEHMFFKGTAKRPNALAISTELDGIGAEYNAFTGKEYTGYWVKTEPKKIKVALDVISDMLLHPRLGQEDINMEKGVIIEELNMYRDNPMIFIEDVFEQCLYGDTPAGRDTVGTKETIAGMKPTDFVNYLNSQYTVKNTIICLAGNIKSVVPFIKEVAEHFFARKEFSSRGQNFKEKEKVVEKQSQPQVKIHFKKTDQAHLALGVRSFGYAHQDRTILKFISILLGGSMSSRLFVTLREKHGLAYYVRAEEESYTDSGYLAARAGVPVDKISLALKLIVAEFNKLKNNLVSATELRKVKDLIRGRFTLQLEASDNLVNFYGRQAILYQTLARSDNSKSAEFFKKVITPEGFLQDIDKVTARDIKRVANEIFKNNKLNLAVIGPYQNNKEFKKILDF